VAILNKTDAIRRKRRHAIKLADEFLRATFLDMFGDPVTNRKGVENLKSKMREGNSETKGCFNSLTQRAFRGEI